MKQFNIKGKPFFDPQTKLYNIWLGNHRGIFFTSKRNLSAFIAAANRFFTDAFIELNTYYKIIFCEYRDTWFLLTHDKNGKPVNLSEFERTLYNRIQSVEDQFNRASFNMNGEKGGTFALHNLVNVCDYLSEICYLLMEFHKERLNPMHYHNLSALKSNIIRLHHTILLYPEVLPEGAVKIHQN